METEINMYFDLAVQWLSIAATVIGSFAAVATMTPNKSDDKMVAWLLKLINVLGANIGRAKNDEDTD